MRSKELSENPITEGRRVRVTSPSASVTVGVEIITDRYWVKRAALKTRHLDPLTPGLSDKGFLGLLLGLHSPIQEFKIWVDLDNLAERVHTHLVRHRETGKYVATSRPDIEDELKAIKNKLADELGAKKNQVSFRSMAWTINAERVIEIAKRRLCVRSWDETIQATLFIKDALEELEPVLASLMFPTCVWLGECPEGAECCGYDETADFHAERDQLLSSFRSVRTVSNKNRKKMGRVLAMKKGRG